MEPPELLSLSLFLFSPNPMGIFEPLSPPFRLRSCATPAGHLCDTNQQRHSHVIGFYVMLSSPGVALLLRVAAADSVYLFSVEVNS